MAAVFEVDLGSLAQATNDLFRLGYGIYTDQRDNAYQRELNETMMQREDSAIQRRVKDAVKAGINPYDAIGAGSGAGASAGTGFKSSGLPNGLNVGSLLDYSIMKEKLKQEQEATKQAKNQSKLLSDAAIRSAIDREYSVFGFRNNTGFVPITNNEKGFFTYMQPDDVNSYSGDNYDFYKDSKQYKEFLAGFSNFMNQSDILTKENSWYNTNALLNAINSGTGSIGNIFGLFKGGAGMFRDIGIGKSYMNKK